MSNHVTAQITLHYKAKRPNGMQEIEQHFDQEGFGPLFRGLILRRELNPVSPARVSQRVSFATLREGHELNGLNVANVRCKWTKWNARDTAKNKYEDESLADCRSRFGSTSFM